MSGFKIDSFVSQYSLPVLTEETENCLFQAITFINYNKGEFKAIIFFSQNEQFY